MSCVVRHNKDTTYLLYIISMPTIFFNAGYFFNYAQTYQKLNSPKNAVITTVKEAHFLKKKHILRSSSNRKTFINSKLVPSETSEWWAKSEEEKKDEIAIESEVTPNYGTLYAWIFRKHPRICNQNYVKSLIKLYSIKIFS